MTLGKLRAAKREATWFLEKLRILENRLEKDGDNLLWGGCRESGAVRRASLDLSRTLSDLRKSF